ncbi:MAG: hypothetical protein ACHQ53_04865, partial [Polyangiales bacterium]
MNPVAHTEPSPAVSVQPSGTTASGAGAASVYAGMRQRFETEVQRRQAQSERLSMLRLGAFIGAAALITTALSRGGAWAWALGLGCAVVFIAGVIAQQRVLSALDAARVRRDVHGRHLMRLSSEWTQLEIAHERLLPATHDYAWDVDVLGQGSLVQRIDVTRTVHGERTLCDWLGTAASLEVIRARQAAVNELA